MDIKIVAIRLQNSGKPLKAFVDVQLDGLELRDFRVIQQSGDRAYIVSPQISWRNKYGKTNFKTIITMPDDLKWKVESTILAGYQRAKEKQNGSTTVSKTMV